MKDLRSMEWKYYKIVEMDLRREKHLRRKCTLPFLFDELSFKNQEKTSMFSLKKESWIEGPYLPPTAIDSLGYDTNVCITALNRTSVLFIGMGQSEQEVLLYDFAKDSWFQLEDTPKKIIWCTSSSAHEKDNKQ